MSNDPEISVIIPLFNKEKVITRALDSVVFQDVKHQIIVIDDGSTDKSGELVRRHSKSINYFRTDNRGPSAARNFGAQLAEAPILVFLDADDELVQGALSKHLEARRMWPEIVVSQGGFSIISSPDSHRSRSPVDELGYAGSLDLTRHDDFHSSLITDIHVSSISVNAAEHIAIGGFDSELRCWEITDYLLRLALRKGGRALIGTQVSIKHEEDLSTSQFERLKKDPKIGAAFASKACDIVANLPVQHQTSMLGPVSFVIEGLFLAGHLSAFRRCVRMLEPFEDSLTDPEIRKRSKRLSKLANRSDFQLTVCAILQRFKRLIG